MVSTSALTSISSSPFIKHLVIVPSALITTGITITLVFHRCFCVLAWYQYLSLSLISFIFTLQSVRKAKSSIWQVLYFCCWLSLGMCRHLEVCFYLNIPENFVHHILHGRFLVVHIPPVRFVKFKFLAKFSVDHLSHPVVSSLILILR